MASPLMRNVLSRVVIASAQTYKPISLPRPCWNLFFEFTHLALVYPATFRTIRYHAYTYTLFMKMLCYAMPCYTILFSMRLLTRYGPWSVIGSCPRLMPALSSPIIFLSSFSTLTNSSIAFSHLSALLTPPDSPWRDMYRTCAMSGIRLNTLPDIFDSYTRISFGLTRCSGDPSSHGISVRD